MGDRDEALPGAQDSLVYLDFGRPVFWDNQWEIQIMDRVTFIPLSRVEEEAKKFASGYFFCVGSDTSSQLTLAIGTSNEDNLDEDSPDDYVTYDHGEAWANMILRTAGDIEDLIYGSQVEIVTASDMELHFNDPVSTRAWVDGVNDVFFDEYTEQFSNIIYNIGDAEGCSQQPYIALDWDTCGSVQFPEWTAEDVWYISDGCQSCEAFPMIYTDQVPGREATTSDWTSAAQWERLSEFSVANHVVAIQFAGELTQSGACEQRPDEDRAVCADPAEGYQRLYSTIHSISETSLELEWSLDIRWMPTPTPLP